MISSFYKTNFPISWTKNYKNKFLILSRVNPARFLPISVSKRIIRLFLFSLPFFFQQCASSGFGTQGLLYENQRISMLETGITASKEGFACSKSYLGLIAFGDASIEMAQRQGNIKEITSIELETYNFFGIYAKLCTVTRGN
ncbi:TRL-like family protein [Leptospira sp.]|nr:TRL-like family protein [Leptospira sp.]